MAHPLTYRERLPPLDLAPFIACFWEITGIMVANVAVEHRVLPDGCADVVLDLRAARARSTQAMVVGPMTAALPLSLSGTLDLLGVRLRPGLFSTVFGPSATELLDRDVGLSDLCRTLTIDPGHLAGSAPEMRVQILIETFRRHVSRVRLPAQDTHVALILACWSAPRRGSGPISIAEAAKVSGLTERALERRFARHVGLAPARTRRLARFRAALRLHADGSRNWLDVCSELGYADQSHLIHDFADFTGLSPSRWAASQAPGVGFLQDGRVTTL